MKDIRTYITGIGIGLIILFIGIGFLEIVGKGSSSQSVESSTAVTMRALALSERALDSVDAAQTADNTGLIIAALAFLAMIFLAMRIPGGCDSGNHMEARAPEPERIYIHVLPDGSKIEGKLIEAPKAPEQIPYNYPADMWEQRQIEGRWS